MEEESRRRLPTKEERRLQDEESTRFAKEDEERRLEEARSKSARLKALRESQSA